ncbi:hypothetical protein G134_44 [Lactobacillus delbrueckii subsp. lactis CRL581]|nr:hypothetical protein HMPREF5505_1289 [Lactobacillus delbrueckii subsp. lactis DSM 20072]EPB99225.1 hypothetical protein G134_44 [Lactobacillus delbrueckii subsp. lactis CRL581]
MCLALNFLFRKNTGILLEDLLYSTVTDFLNADKKQVIAGKIL